MNETTPPIKWHSIFAAMLRELLTPLQIRVLDEVPVSGNIDTLLIQLLEGPHWTEAQRQVLPDGLRDSLATRLLIELKYSQSLEEDTFRQAITYDFLYRQQPELRNLSVEAIQTFIVSAKTPQAETLNKFHYQPSEWAGVYVSDDLLLHRIPLLVLNQLSDEPHNVFFKLFASRRQAKLAAMATLQGYGLTGKLFWLIKGLLNRWFKSGGDFMEAITAETLMEEGKHLVELLAPLLTEEELLQLPTGQKVLEKGREEGLEEGLEKGREEGLEEGLEKGREEGLEEGLEKGREEGLEEGRQEMFAVLLRTLPRLFEAEISPELQERLHGLTLPQLRRVMDVAFEAETWGQVEQFIQELTPKLPHTGA